MRHQVKGVASLVTAGVLVGGFGEPADEGRLMGVPTIPPSVCEGEDFQVTVPLTERGVGSRVTINGLAGMPRWVQFVGAEGERFIDIYAQRSAEEAELCQATTSVKKCDQPFLVVHTRPDPFRRTAVDFEAAPALQKRKIRATSYLWNFGDDEEATTEAPFVVHDYARALARQEGVPVHLFQATIRVNGPDDVRVAHKTVAIPDPRLPALPVGAARDVLDYVQATVMLKTVAGQPERLSVTVTNDARNPAIEIAQAIEEDQPCDPTARPDHVSHDAQALLGGGEISPGGTRSGTLIAPPGLCGVFVRVVGTSAPQRRVYGGGHVELRANPNAMEDADPVTAKMLNEVTQKGWVENCDRVGVGDLYRLKGEKQIERKDGQWWVAWRTGAPPCREHVTPQCDPVTAPRPGLQCKATQDWRLQRSYLANASKGDLVVCAGCGLISTLLQSLNQTFSHVGILSTNRYDVAQAYAVTNRFGSDVNLQAKALRPEVLRYGWTGRTPQTVDAAFLGGPFPQPPGDKPHEYWEAPFDQTPADCAGQDVPIQQPLILKPPPEFEVSSGGVYPRPRLEAAADRALALHVHYRVFAFSDAVQAADAGHQALADCGLWGCAGSRGAMCASNVWLALRAAGVQVNATGDGLFDYPERVRADAARHLHDQVRNLVRSGDLLHLIGSILTHIDSRVANQVTNCFVLDRCDIEAAGTTDWEHPGTGRTVSPDQTRLWPRPPDGVYGYAEYAVLKPGRYLRRFAWQ